MAFFRISGRTIVLPEWRAGLLLLGGPRSGKSHAVLTGNTDPGTLIITGRTPALRRSGMDNCTYPYGNAPARQISERAVVIAIDHLPHRQHQPPPGEVTAAVKTVRELLPRTSKIILDDTGSLIRDADLHSALLRSVQESKLPFLATSSFDGHEYSILGSFIHAVALLPEERRAWRSLPEDIQYVTRHPHWHLDDPETEHDPQSLQVYLRRSQPARVVEGLPRAAP